MTVKQLIEMLEKYDPNFLVVIEVKDLTAVADFVWEDKLGRTVEISP